MSAYHKRLLAENQWVVVSEKPLTLRHAQSRTVLSVEQSTDVLEDLDRQASERDTREMPALTKQEPAR